MVVSYDAQPDAGVCVSQPMFANRAWVTLPDMTPPLTVVTGSTYHQGGGTSVVTFSAGHGGTVCNARPQMVDYKTAAVAGVLAVPDEGYAFAGWRHDDYYSLRGERVRARSGILHYDTLVIFGNVALRADFELIRYPVRYYLNGGENAEANPSAYTRASAVKLEAPRKAGDEFVGWTGSNGVVPQATVIIPEGSTGEREFYANYLRSGREDVSPQPTADMVWAVDGDLHIRTSKAGSVARIYTPDGILEGVHALPLPGLTRIRLGRGVHIVILNSVPAQKVIIE